MPTRRSFLAWSAAAVASRGLAACKPGPVDDVEDTAPPRPALPASDWPGLVAEDVALFPMGGQSGDPLPDRAVFTTRYLGAAALHLHHAVWDGSAWADGPVLPATVADGGFVRVDAELPSGAWIAWQFVDDDGRASRPSLMRSAPALTDAPSLKFGVGSCFHQRHEAFPVLAATLNEGPLDAFLFLGDTAYFDDAFTRDAYRALWQQNLTTDAFPDVLSTTACVYTWDDHEVANGWAPETISPERLNIAREAFFEALPIRRDESAPERVWRSLRFGTTAEVFVLDCRSERNAAAGTYLSRAQMAWLKDSLAASPCTWKLVMNSVPILLLDTPGWDTPLALEDRWEGFPASREELLNSLEANDVQGVLFLSGDVHLGLFGRVESTGYRSTLWDAVIGPGGSTLNPLGLGMDVTETWPFFKLAYNAATVELDPAGTAEIRYVGEDGATLGRIRIHADGTLLSAEVAPEEP
jgi:alkaline phosphatase D